MSPRDEWLLMANMVLPSVETSSPSGRSEAQYQLDIAKNLNLTRRAIGMGVALSAIDGPLPVMDVVAFIGVTTYTTVLWYNFYTDYF